MGYLLKNSEAQLIIISLSIISLSFIILTYNPIIGTIFIVVGWFLFGLSQLIGINNLSKNIIKAHRGNNNGI